MIDYIVWGLKFDLFAIACSSCYRIHERLSWGLLCGNGGQSEYNLICAHAVFRDVWLHITTYIRPRKYFMYFIDIVERYVQECWI